eukprot:TRINITY_DN7184_c0_g6_i1.p4 TRINITY_DN7184_c0_g6~~TRINITY_DN7184_c0_g6_i1.p4  ORF type:complete len:103 (+),score=25.44 TRINITY_DN7184_c0_g6_i1:1112-1420(+)
MKLNEQLQDEFTSLTQENRCLKEGLTSERKESKYRQMQKENSELEATLKKQATQIGRLETELIITKQHLAETLNIMQELEQSEVFECEMSFSRNTSVKDNIT